MKETSRPAALPYLVAVASVAIAFALRAVLDPALGERQPFVTFYFAVTLTAWFGGPWSALAATFLGYFVSDWFFITPRYTLSLLQPSAGHLIGSALYIFLCAVITGLTSLMQRKARAAISAEEAARQSAARLGAIISSATDAIITIDADQRVTVFNSSAEEMFGYSADDMIGRSLDSLIPERWREVHRGHVKGFGKAGNHTRQMGSERVLAGLRRTGDEFPIEAHISQVTVDGQQLYTVIIRDSTERKRAEEERAKLLAVSERARHGAESATNRMQRMQRITDAMLGDLPLDAFLQEVLVRVRDALAANVAVILVREEDEESNVLRLRAAAGFEETVDASLRIRVGEYFAGRVAQEQRPLVWNDPDPELVWPFLRRTGVRALAGVPLLSDGRLLGVLHVGSTIPREFTDEDVDLLRLAGDRIAFGIERTARRDAERRERQVLETSNRTKDEFLAMLGHELRNPLSAVRNAVVAASLDSDQRPRALEIARRQTDQLGRLIDDLLDVARITQGRITLRKERVQLAEVIQRAVESMRPFIEESGLRLSGSVVGEPLRIEADPGRVEQVLVNILTNAAKYTDRGGHIEFALERQDDHALVRIRDTGCGITPELLPRIWDLFTQADRSLDRAQGGLGIGLTVARRLVELHGGRIEAFSEGVGTGAEFAIKFPLLSGSADEIRPSAPAALPTLQRRARILIVEDNADAAESLSMLLELLGHKVHAVYNGIAALDEVRATVPDIMLVDIGLPGISGHEVARRVRRDPSLSNVVLVALTGYGRTEDKQQAIAAGFDYHLVKPVSTEALEHVFTRLPNLSAAAE